MQESKMSMDAAAVIEYLKAHPGFFEDYADAVAEIFVPHPHGGHAIPIAERQILALRDKAREQERRLAELVRHAEENDAITEKLHRITLALIAARDLETTIAVLVHGLAEDFSVPRIAIRLWRDGQAQTTATSAPGISPGALPEFAPVSPAVREFAQALPAPSCTNAPQHETGEWFGDDGAMQSFAYLPLRTGATFGILAFASPDPQRFHPAVGTMYLIRLDELASVAIARYRDSG